MGIIKAQKTPSHNSQQQNNPSGDAEMQPEDGLWAESELENMLERAAIIIESDEPLQAMEDRCKDLEQKLFVVQQSANTAMEQAALYAKENSRLKRAKGIK